LTQLHAVRDSEQQAHGAGVKSMLTWETPEFVEIRMDAEINYMDDLAGDDPSPTED